MLLMYAAYSCRNACVPGQPLKQAILDEVRDHVEPKAIRPLSSQNAAIFFASSRTAGL